MVILNIRITVYFQLLLYCFFYEKSYLNPTAACQTNASNKKKTGIIGNTSTIGLNTTYASGKRASNKLSIIKTSVYNIEYIKFNNIDSTLKISKILIYL